MKGIREGAMAKKKKKFDYFAAYAELAALAVEESHLLIETVEHFPSADRFEQAMAYAHDIENRGDKINHGIYQNVACDFVTPFDREDILALASSFDDILDTIDDVFQRFYMYGIETVHEGVLPFARIIAKSCESLNAAMDDFQNFKKSKEFKRYVVEVNDCEEEADALFRESMRRLHVQESESPLHVHVWSHMFERLEKCTDACEHVADVMNTVILKNV